MGMRHEPPNTAPYTSDRLDNAEFDNLQICNEIALLLDQKIIQRLLSDL